MASEGFRLSWLAVTKCTLTDRSLLAMAARGAALRHLTISECTRDEGAGKLSAGTLRALEALTSLALIRNEASVCALLGPLLGVTSRLGRLRFVCAKGPPDLFLRLASTSLEYVAIHSTESFSPHVQDLLAMLRRSAHSLVSLSFRGIARGDLRAAKLWQGFAAISFPQLRYLELGIPLTESMLPALGASCYRLAFLDTSGGSALTMRDGGEMAIKEVLPTLLAIRGNLGWSIYEELCEQDPPPPPSVIRMIEEDLPIDSVWAASTEFGSRVGVPKRPHVEQDHPDEGRPMGALWPVSG